MHRALIWPLKMAHFHQYSILFATLIICVLLTTPCFCFHPKSFNVWSNNDSYVVSDWSPAVATWYGPPNGAGSDGGSCGYGNSVAQPPFSSFVTAVGSSLYHSGKSCGACYEVKCWGIGACSGNPVTVVVTDSCLGGPFASDVVHFDLSSTAFDALATPGNADQLHSIGVLQIQHRRVQCKYSGTSISFVVDTGSNSHYFATLIKYENGDGDLGSIELKQGDSDSWIPMSQSWGAVWKLESGPVLNPPFSLKLTTLNSANTLIANNVIPIGWNPGNTYTSALNFNMD